MVTHGATDPRRDRPTHASFRPLPAAGPPTASDETGRVDQRLAHSAVGLRPNLDPAAFSARSHPGSRTRKWADHVNPPFRADLHKRPSAGSARSDPGRPAIESHAGDSQQQRLPVQSAQGGRQKRLARRGSRRPRPPRPGYPRPPDRTGRRDQTFNYSCDHVTCNTECGP